MNTEQIIEQNELKRKELTPENLEVYKKVLMYVRADISISERVTEEVMLDLLDHLLEAQLHDVTPSEFFTDNPEQFAKDLIAEIPEESKRNKSLFIISISCIFVAMIFLGNGLVQLALSYFNLENKKAIVPFILSIVLSFLITILIINLLFKFVQRSIFHKKHYFKLILPFVLILLMYYSELLFNNIFPDADKIVIPTYIYFIISALLFVTYKLMYKWTTI
ncbi:DUF1129 family protein [Macrococcus armenti]|uniref:DUF1129 family protein n=1 Tax=Macrococcus armenti TaxID=2875764 RepID=UPI001CC9AAD7|nr:DUF1129 family protein [Macrococcus armenti]UBH09094.1 DUF1129 family protein [Macrococcus armenti]UBH11388.1 DUF1129 family protein [Macrococcus armenti]